LQRTAAGARHYETCVEPGSLKTAPPAADFPHLNTSCGVVKVQVAEIRCGNVTFIAAAQSLFDRDQQNH
jgi:hypothetical protein